MSNIRATFSINAAGTVWGAIDGDISNQTDLQDALDLKADKSELETDIEEVNTAISNLSDTVLDNYNTLDDKIDTEISNRVTADEDLQDNIDTLSNTVTNNYTELNNKILDNTADITTNTSSITNINSKIPEQASASNQLADKNFVNSSIATNTANFIGTFNSIAELEAYSGTLTNNDYAFVSTTDTAGNTLYDRYKWNGSEWLFEYELNNSSFTANQWAAINSGITNTLTTLITTNQNAITNIQNNYVPNTRTINSKALNTNITLNASDVNALPNTTTIEDLTTTAQQNALNSGATSAKINQIATNTGNITTNANAISTINGKIPADASSSNKLVTASALSNAVVNLANQDLSNLTETGNDRLHALKSYSDEGELLTDAEGLADVIKYAHSTFDSSKFNVVGTPTITDDGIAQPFTTSNRLSTGVQVGTFAGKSWEITTAKMIYNATSLTTRSDLISASGSDSLNLAYSTISKNVQFIFKTGTSDAYEQKYISYPIDFAQHTSIQLKASFDISTGVYSFYINVDDTGFELISTYTPTTANKELYITNASPVNLLNIASTAFPVIYPQDLKYIEIKVDGVEVFSGNKTGIDTIKPDDYTVTGSPTISADGVASGFTSSTNYITGSFTSVSATNKVEIWTAIINNSADTNNSVICATNGNLRIVKINANVIGIRGLSGGLAVNSPNLSLQDGDFVIAHAIVTTTGATLQTWVNGVKQTDVTVSGDFSAIATSYDSLYIGGQYNNGNYSPASAIDMNYCKMLIDGNLVYQPCLKIPYTESKTGSKIVNAVYRGRVNDMASQFSYANYYTLSDTDFTLPQVELYGLIGDKTLRDSYYNGVTYWELFSNRRLEQGGTCESGVEYTLPKPFADANYVLTIPYSSKTATSFIPSATGDFIAKGTGLL